MLKWTERRKQSWMAETTPEWSIALPQRSTACTTTTVARAFGSYTAQEPAGVVETLSKHQY
jgi:hypothetical protein